MLQTSQHTQTFTQEMADHSNCLQATHEHIHNRLLSFLPDIFTELVRGMCEMSNRLCINVKQWIEMDVFVQCISGEGKKH